MSLANGLTPSSIELVLHCYWNTDPEVTRFTKEDWADASTYGLVDPDGKVTERGAVYARALLSMPLPVQKWAMP